MSPGGLSWLSGTFIGLAGTDGSNPFGISETIHVPPSASRHVRVRVRCEARLSPIYREPPQQKHGQNASAQHRELEVAWQLDNDATRQPKFDGKHNAMLDIPIGTHQQEQVHTHMFNTSGFRAVFRHNVRILDLLCYTLVWVRVFSERGRVPFGFRWMKFCKNLNLLL